MSDERGERASERASEGAAHANAAMLLGIVLYKAPKIFQNKEPLSGILA